MSAATNLTVRPQQGQPLAGQCGARKKRSQGLCSKAAGWRTDHPGVGRCYLHGGATPVRSGRYSKVRSEALRALIAQHEADPDPLNILPELAAARALFEDFVSRYDEWREALLAWYESYSPRRLSPEHAEAFRRSIDEWEIALRERGELASERQREDLDLAREFVRQLTSPDERRPRYLLDVSAAVGHVDTITKIVERIEKIRGENAISRADLHRVITEMGRVVEAYVPDEEKRDKIRDGWLAIRI